GDDRRPGSAGWRVPRADRRCGGGREPRACIGPRALDRSARHDAACVGSRRASPPPEGAPLDWVATAEVQRSSSRRVGAIGGQRDRCLGASSGEIGDWTKFARVASRYPEVRRLDVIRREGLPPAPAPTTLRRAAAPSRSTTLSRTPATTTLSGAPAGMLVSAASRSASALGPPRCFIAGGLAGGTRLSATTRDVCARNPALLASRDSGRASYSTVSIHRRSGLEILTPVYHGAGVPVGLAARR